MATFYYWFAVAMVVLAVVLGKKDGDGIYMPHSGFILNAILGLLFMHANQ